MMQVGMLAATLWTATVALAPAHKALSFVGFSRNEQVNAWRQTVVQPQHDGLVDHYTLIRVYETEGQHLLATYRDGTVRRTDRNGHFVFTSESAQRRDNPDYAAARSHGEWNHVSHEARFQAGRLDFTDTTVRLNTDNDTRLVDVWADNKTIFVEAQPGSPIGYAPVARLMDGQLVTLGHFRVETDSTGHKAHAEVQVYYSRSGKNIALLNRFHVDNEDQERSQMLIVSTNDPIASTGVGTLGIIHDDAETTRRLFIEMHPKGGEKLWDDNEGREF